MRIHCLQHMAYEGPARIEQWAVNRGHHFTYTRFWDEKFSFPEIHDIDWLVIMGGPMGVYEEHLYPWMTEEKRFIERFIASGKPIMGICLGGQLIADVLGAKVEHHEFPEIGWHEIVRLPEARGLGSLLPTLSEFFQWHTDSFEIPHGATRIASSRACANQAFTYRDNIIGLQFHPEMTPFMARRVIRCCPTQINKISPFVQTSGQILADVRKFEQANRVMDKIMRGLEHLAWSTVEID